ncbi:MAG: Cro/CI family transcriptional regulator [Aeromonas sp.]
MKKQDVISYFGRAIDVADALGLSSQAISQWGETIPHGRACEIELLTGGALKVEQAPVELAARNPAQ